LEGRQKWFAGKCVCTVQHAQEKDMVFVENILGVKPAYYAVAAFSSGYLCCIDV